MDTIYAINSVRFENPDFPRTQEEMSLIVLKNCTMFHTITQYTISLYFISFVFYKICVHVMLE